MRNALFASIPFWIAAPISSLKDGKCHLSGDSTTPSSEMKKYDTILPTSLSSLVTAEFCLGVTYCDRPPRNNSSVR
jgi:hypothetical protein